MQKRIIYRVQGEKARNRRKGSHKKHAMTTVFGLLAASNILSFTAVTSTLINNLPVQGFTTSERMTGAGARMSVGVSSLFTGAGAGVTAYNNILNDDYCYTYAGNTGLETAISNAVHRNFGDEVHSAFVSVVTVVSAPGAALGGVLVGGYVGVREVLTNGAYTTPARCPEISDLRLG